MNKFIKALLFLAASFVFYLLTGNADLAFFGWLMLLYIEFRDGKQSAK